MTETFLFIIGLAMGSFLNVVIYRLPRNESLVRPRSHCTGCGKPLAWYDNIPVLSFLFLGGKCRSCRQKISWRYPAVELASGFLWYGAWQWSAGLPLFWISVIFGSFLLVETLTDIETGIIPDEVTLGGALTGLVASFLYPSLHQSPTALAALFKSGTGLLAGGGLIYITGLAGNWIFQRELMKRGLDQSMGGGDVKLLAMIGSFLGWEKVLLTFFTAPFLALPFALYRRLAKKEAIIPYGPFLALAAALHFFWGGLFWRYFLSL